MWSYLLEFLTYYNFWGNKSNVQVTCTYDSRKCQHPCSICMCPSRELRVVHNEQINRTEPMMKEVLQRMRAAPRTTDAISISKQYSMHQVEVSLS